MDMSLETFRETFRRPFQFREFLDQTWMIARVSLVPTLLVAIPFTVLVAFTLSCTVRTISTGQVGVATLFGAITGERLPEGIHFVNPLKRIARHARLTSYSYRDMDSPPFLVLFINSICNMKCEHCFFAVNLNVVTTDLSPVRVRRIFQSLP